MSRGTSTITGPARPFFSALKALRIAEVVGPRNDDFLDLLGDGCVGDAGAKCGEDLGLVSGMSERQEQHRDAVGECRSDAGKGVLRPWAILHHEYAGRPAVGDAGKPIRHIDAHPLLPADDGADAGGDGVLDEGCRWKAEERRHALTA